MSRSSGRVGLGVLNRAVHQGSYFVHYLLIFNCFCLSVSGSIEPSAEWPGKTEAGAKTP